eukprot:gb/GECG01009732.1/.p1 GENE.gb/GECG01009732.1/~~gb/GECG01009732.1/.p1  ORF type:complete len:407 (+),score=44.06 gb/GECG01009732.1/:1-1221(+)
MAAAGNRSELEGKRSSLNRWGIHDNKPGVDVSPSAGLKSPRRSSPGTPFPESQRNVFRKSSVLDEASETENDDHRGTSGLPEESKRSGKRKERGRKSRGNAFTFEGYAVDDEDDDETSVVDDGAMDQGMNRPISVHVDTEDDVAVAMEEQRQAENPSLSSRCTRMWSSILSVFYTFCGCCARRSEPPSANSDMEVTGSPSTKKRAFRHRLKSRLITSKTSVAEGAEGGSTKRDTRPRGRASQDCYSIMQKLSKWTSAREFFTLHAVRFVAITAGLAYSTLILFTRHLYGVVHAFFGLLFSMEAYNGARRRDRKLVLYYSLALVLSAIVSILIGTTLLNQANFECFLAENPDTCSSVQFAWGTVSVLMAIGEGAAAFVVFVAWSNMRTRREIEREHFQRKHEHAIPS